jgi:large subunit ribosomal protein L3
MAGHMGNTRITTQNLKVVGLDLEEGLILVKGAVPGSKNGWVLVSDAVKKQTKDIELPMPAGLKQVAEQQNTEAPAENAAEATQENSEA